MGWIPPNPPPPSVRPGGAYQVECAGCGAPTAYHEHACSYCTRPTGRQPRVQAAMLYGKPISDRTLAEVRAEWERKYTVLHAHIPLLLPW